MLQEIADDGAHMNILADAGNVHLQATDSPDNQVNLYACCGRLIEGHNHIPVAQGIHLRDDPALASVFRMLLLSLD